MEIRGFNSDGTRRICPHGASVCFPSGTLARVKVGDQICHLCPLFGNADFGKDISVTCNYKKQ